MFDKLIESQKTKNGGKIGRYLTTSAILYGTILTILTIATIVGYGPVLAENDELLSILPLVPAKSVDSTPQMPKQQRAVAAAGGGIAFAIPTENTKIVSDLPSGMQKFGPYVSRNEVPGSPGGSIPGFIDGKAGSNEPPPPPPSSAKPAPSPESKQGLTKLSEGVLQGGAVLKVKPLYPVIARQIRLSGLVQVQIMISEDGKVMQATAINGHTLLQRAAVEAARQWVFSPTYLTKVPVKVQGVISFNFVFN